MKKEEIITVLAEWNFWGRGLETGIKRDYAKKFLEYLEGVNKILSAYGVRRAGKSFVLRDVAKTLSESYGDRNTLYVNFEETKFDETLDRKFLWKIYEAFLEIIKPESKPFILLDEVQEIEGWEKVVRTLHEKDEARIIVTGSSAKLMSEELSTLLSGRGIKMEIFPLNFLEFMKFRGFSIKNKSEILINYRKIIAYLREYLEFGAFPECVLERNEEKRRRILREYFDTILLKDVERRFSIKNTQALEKMAFFYISNISSPVTFRRVSKSLGIPVKTVERYSKYIESSRMILFVKRFSFSVKEQENSPRKVYSIDTGLSNTVGFRFLENYGRIIENLVAVELLRRGKEIFYYKSQDQKEVDFVVKEGLKVKELIQVCYDLDFNTKERELKALVKASKELDCNSLLVITWDHEGEEEFRGERIQFKPLWKWLLNM